MTLGLALGVMGATNADRAPAAEPGVVMVGGAAAATPQGFAALDRSGAKWARVFLYWTDAEPRPGHLEPNILAHYDSMVENVRAQGRRLLFVVTGAPPWASGSQNPNSPPQDPAAYASFIGRLAARWKGKVDAYEIWNEQDEGRFWVGGPDAPAYTRLLRGAHQAVKAADPAATVVLGGMVGNDYGFLDQVYAAGGKGSFDAVGVHTDTACNTTSPDSFYREADGRIGRFAFLGYREVKAVMLANGEDKPVWMTELGWSSTTAICDVGINAGKKAGGVTPEQQRDFLRLAYHCLNQDDIVRVGIWFSLSDDTPRDDPESRFGLFSHGFGAPKPAFTAFRTVVDQGPALDRACGDFGGPTISGTSPAPGTFFYGALPLRLQARDPQGVARLTLLIDGRKIRNFTSREARASMSGGLTWQGAKRLGPGSHTITFVAVDRNGNTTQTSARITKLGTGEYRSVRTLTTAEAMKPSGRRRSVRLRVTSRPEVSGMPGKVTLTSQRRRGGRWVTTHRDTKPASRTAMIRRTWRPGRWRLVARYPATKPFRGSQAKTVRFTVR